MPARISVTVFDVNGVEPFLESQGLTFANGLVDRVLSIDLREKPLILVELEAAGFFAGVSRTTWDLYSLTSAGMTLYLAHRDAGDGYVFIPFDNILAIHTVNSAWLDDVRAGSAN